MPDRRRFLKTAAAAAVAPLLTRCAREEPAPRWTRAAFRKTDRSRVAVLEAESYDADLTDLVGRGIALFDLPVRGRRVVLKPNFVEYDPAGAINTEPRLIAGTMEAFRRAGAREVVVAEGPGHRRDNEYLLTASGLHDALRQVGGRYTDLNVDAVRAVAKTTSYTGLARLYLPETVLDADLIVSMPKLKTHHWAGVTLSMKNLFGIMPGAVYGWPKNVLHHAGIAESILEINAALRVPRFNIVDGIIGMEGNGPIQGEARASRVLVLGEDPVAVDATAARLMTIDPMMIGYLREADAFLGNATDDRIEQLAEDPERLRQDYVVMPGFEFVKPASLATGA